MISLLRQTQLQNTILNTETGFFSITAYDWNLCPGKHIITQHNFKRLAYVKEIAAFSGNIYQHPDLKQFICSGCGWLPEGNLISCSSCVPFMGWQSESGGKKASKVRPIIHTTFFSYSTSESEHWDLHGVWMVVVLLMMVILFTLPGHSSTKPLPERELHAHLLPSAAYFLRKSHLVNGIQAITAGLNAGLLPQKEVSVSTAL